MSAAETSAAAELPIDALVLARDEAETGHYASALPALESVLLEFQQRGTAFWCQACRMVLVRLWLDLGQYARAVPLLRDEPAEMPVWLRADRHLLQLDLARALEQPAPAGALAEALALAQADPQRGPVLRVRALRFLPPAEALSQAEDLAGTLKAKERFGALLALHAHTARAALSVGDTRTAVKAARTALALFDEGYAPDAMYLPAAHLLASQALTRAGEADPAAAAVRAGTDWIRRRALPQVPAPFLDSFLHRNAVNRELLAAASQAQAGC